MRPIRGIIRPISLFPWFPEKKRKEGEQNSEALPASLLGVVAQLKRSECSRLLNCVFHIPFLSIKRFNHSCSLRYLAKICSKKQKTAHDTKGVCFVPHYNPSSILYKSNKFYFPPTFLSVQGSIAG
jgi:hypothetical protein